MAGVVKTLVAGWTVALIGGGATAEDQAASPAQAEQVADVAGAAPERGLSRFFGLPHYDRRASDARTRQAVGEALAAPERAARRRAARLLAADVPGLTVDFDEFLGTPTFVRATSGLLAPPINAPFDARDRVASYALDRPAIFGLSGAQIASARATRLATTERTGLTVVWLQQTVDGVDVLGAELRGAVTREGGIASVCSTMLPAPPGGFAPALPAIDRQGAIRLAAEAVGVRLAGALTPKSPRVDDRGRQTFERPPELQLDVETQFVYFPLTAGEMRPAYVNLVSPARSSDVYEVIVNGVDGQVLRRRNCTWYGGAAPATYRVHTSDSPAPRSPGPNAPDGSQATETARTLRTLVSESAIASPEGWIPDASNETVGNNADAHLDRNFDNMADLPRPQGSPFRVFDFPLDLGLAPTAPDNQGAGVVQVFYWTNWFHDRMYGLGFTEPFGNFQFSNFGRGGVEFDRIQADCQDGAFVNNANFVTTGTDGAAARMQMYLWPGATPGRDGGLDAEIVLHELTHGLSTRLHGSLSGSQCYGLGEGWSDFYALSLLAEPGEDPSGAYAVGAYSSFLSLTNYVNNYYFGIRRFPYSTDFLKSPLTFADIDGTQFGFDASVPRGPWGVSQPSEAHNVGEVWCAALWQCRAEMIAVHGFAANETMLELVTDAMALSPQNPTFIQARDAVLLADRIATGGANQCLLWRGFAQRGLGVGASGPGPSETTGVIESFAEPTNVEFTYPAGDPPYTAAPGTPTMFTVALGQPCVGTIMPGTESLRVSVNGAPFTSAPLAPGAPGQHVATLPAFECGQSVRYYVSAQTDAGVQTDPPGAPAHARSLTIATSEPATLDDSFETDLGWTVGGPTDDATTGLWARVDPNGTGAQPEDDHTPGAGTTCWVTGQGAPGDPIGSADVDGGTTTLTSPAFDCTGGEAHLSYWRWYSNDQGAEPNTDSMPVEISGDNGSNWTLLEDVSENAGAWVFRRWRVADVVPPSTQVRVRFRARDLGIGSLIEAGVDDVRATIAMCASSLPADLNGDGSVNASDLALLLGSWGPCPEPCAADLNDDGAVGAGDLAQLLGSWT